MAAPTVLIVPGLRDHVAEHWQTLLAAQLPPRAQRAADGPRRSATARRAWRRSSASCMAIRGPLIIVAHSGGVIMLAHWAATQNRTRRPIRGALAGDAAGLRVADAGRLSDDGGAARAAAGCRCRASRCRFRASSRPAATTRSGRYDRVAELARAWGSRARRPRRGRPPEPGLGLWRVAAGRRLHPRTGGDDEPQSRVA